MTDLPPKRDIHVGEQLDPTARMLNRGTRLDQALDQLDRAVSTLQCVVMVEAMALVVIVVYEVAK